MKIQPEQLHSMQQIIPNIFKEVKVIFDKYDLRYFAIGGTCIGAVRHHGFIPWDDDMDIAMPEPDYRRFIEIARRELPDYLGVFERREHDHDPINAARVHDKRTTFIQTHEVKYPGEYKGVFIDILPLCGVPDGEKEQRDYCKKFCRYFRMNEKRRCSFFYLDRLPSRVLWLAALPFRLLPRDFWFRRLDKLTAKYPYDKMKLTGDTWVAHIDNILFDKKIYARYIELPFEDTVMRCSAEYDAYLKRIFGDYMTLPPEDKRGDAQNATIVLIDTEKPYTYYQKLAAESGGLPQDSTH